MGRGFIRRPYGPLRRSDNGCGFPAAQRKEAFAQIHHNRNRTGDCRSPGNCDRCGSSRQRQTPDLRRRCGGRPVHALRHAGRPIIADRHRLGGPRGPRCESHCRRREAGRLEPHRLCPDHALSRRSRRRRAATGRANSSRHIHRPWPQSPDNGRGDRTGMGSVSKSFGQRKIQAYRRASGRDFADPRAACRSGERRWKADSKAAPGGGEQNPYCARSEKRPPDRTENARSLVSL